MLQCSAINFCIVHISNISCTTDILVAKSNAIPYTSFIWALGFRILIAFILPDYNELYIDVEFKHLF